MSKFGLGSAQTITMAIRIKFSGKQHWNEYAVFRIVTNVTDPFFQHGVEPGHRRGMPAVAWIGIVAVQTEFLLLVMGGTTVSILKVVIPRFEESAMPYVWYVLPIIWAPGVLGLLLAFYSIVAYPDLSRRIAPDRSFEQQRTPLLKFGGRLLYVIATLLAFASSLGGDARSTCIGMIAAGSFGYFGFLLADYDSRRHTTLATYMMLTSIFGIVLFPLYLPFITVGAIRNARRSATET